MRCSADDGRTVDPTSVGGSAGLVGIIEPELTKSLTLLINQVLITGIFPDKLKIAKVIPVL